MNHKIEKMTVSTTNACKLCTPLGASIVFRGVKGAIPIVHGSQGCATYMRRYLIGHFREPVDIASSNFTESSTIFGGGSNLKQGLLNIIAQYKPEFIGIASSCLSETIGDDLKIILNEFKKENKDIKLPEIVSVSTPSYMGSHINGYYKAVNQIVETCAQPGEEIDQINLISTFISPADIRYLKGVLEDFKQNYVFLPDYSDTFDGPVWNKYHRIPKGGTEIEKIKSMGKSKATLQLGLAFPDEIAGKYLEKKMNVPFQGLDLPIGIYLSDRFFESLEKMTGLKTPLKYLSTRERLIDAYIDAHKYVFGKRVAIYGDDDLVVALTSFLTEIGMKPILCATGSNSTTFVNKIKNLTRDLETGPKILNNVDFFDIEKQINQLEPDLLVGNSKGYSITKKTNTPLLRVGFPIHDRFGAGRVLSLGYEGTFRLFDELVNLLITQKQKASPIGYAYL